MQVERTRTGLQVVIFASIRRTQKKCYLVTYQTTDILFFARFGNQGFFWIRSSHHATHGLQALQGGGTHPLRGVPEDLPRPKGGICGSAMDVLLGSTVLLWGFGLSCSISADMLDLWHLWVTKGNYVTPRGKHPGYLPLKLNPPGVTWWYLVSFTKYGPESRNVIVGWAQKLR